MDAISNRTVRKERRNCQHVSSFCKDGFRSYGLLKDLFKKQKSRMYINASLIFNESCVCVCTKNCNFCMICYSEMFWQRSNCSSSTCCHKRQFHDITWFFRCQTHRTCTFNRPYLKRSNTRSKKKITCRIKTSILDVI